MIRRNPFPNPSLPGKGLPGEQQVAQQCLVRRSCLADAGNEPLRDDQEMDGGLGVNIVDDDTEVILVLDLRRDLPGQ